MYYKCSEGEILMNNLLLLGDACADILPILRVLRQGVIPLIQMGIPILLIVLGTVDLGKAVIASEDKEVKAAQTRLIKRIIYAVVIFFITTIVSLVFNLVADYSGQDNDGNNVGADADSWSTCWKKAAEKSED